MSREEVFKATGPTSGAVDDGQDRRQEGRQDRRRRRRCSSSRPAPFPGSPVMNGCMCGFAPYDIAECAHGRLRRRLQPAEVGRLSRARLADLGLRGGERDRRDGARKIGMDPLEFRLKNAAQDGHADRLRAQARARRLRRNAGGAAEPSGLQGAAGQEPGTRRRLRLLVQRRRRIERDGARQRGRHGAWSRPAARTSAARARRWR